MNNKRYTFTEFYNREMNQTIDQVLALLFICNISVLITMVIVNEDVVKSIVDSLIIIVPLILIISFRIKYIYYSFMKWLAHPYEKELKKLEKDIEEANDMINLSNLY